MTEKKNEIPLVVQSIDFVHLARFSLSQKERVCYNKGETKYRIVLCRKREDLCMNFIGLIISIAVFLLIGVFHPIVIKCEYYFTDRCWPAFLVGGVISIAVSLMVENIVASCLLGALGCSFLWSIKELKEQRQRVERGWFPKNPNRKDS